MSGTPPFQSASTVPATPDIAQSSTSGWPQLHIVLGVILGVVGAFGPGGRCLIGLAAGAAIGFAGGLGAIIVSPRFLAGSSASDGIEVFPDGIIMIVISLMIVVTGAVIGRIFGRTRRST